MDSRSTSESAPDFSRVILIEVVLLFKISHGIKNRSAVTPFRCLAAMPPEGCTRAEILPGCPSLDRESREAEVGFEPRTVRSVNSLPNHLSHLVQGILNSCSTDKWMERPWSFHSAHCLWICSNLKMLH
ncbi:hypothetical protein CSKR_102085 [Clonorchis sinensis]|uniref:Uncharacterized protein n=1 Tax=Clonorchis sinensis TaxID=79923 RepID=A0A3R7GC80_CLOSI|nr:hypothetical protein CSKR_102085 [Clonorchis sinensis]